MIDTQLKVRVWAACGQWHGEVSEYNDYASLPDGTLEYNTVYETSSTSYGKVMVNIALSLIRNSTEEME
jgi:hypothetical protein